MEPASSSPFEAKACTSPPAQKFLPSPLSSSTRRSGWPWHTMMASHSALRSSALMPFDASGRLSRSRAMPSAMSRRTGPFSIITRFPPSGRLNEEREREQRLLVVDQDHFLVRHAQLAIDIAQPIFVAGSPDGVIAQ